MEFRKIGVSEKRKRTQCGATLVMFTLLASCVLIPMVGLAIDGSIAFWAKAKLSAAVDAAVLAAGRNVNGTNNVGTNTSTAKLVASQWFYANFPQGWLGSTVLNNGPAINYVMTSSSTQQVTVNASASIPLYFMRVIGQNSITVSASAQSSRRQSYILLILDKSTSMTASFNGSTACAIMSVDAQQFTNMFTDSFDTMGLLEFSSTAGVPATGTDPNNPVMNLNVPLETSFKSDMTYAIKNIDCSGFQFTSTAQALSVAYNNLKLHYLTNGLNAIVLFTDGQPDEVVADFPVRTATEIKTDTDSRYDDSPYDNAYTTPKTYTASGCSLAANQTTILGGLQGASPPLPWLSQYGPTFGLFDIFQNSYTHAGCAYSTNMSDTGNFSTNLNIFKVREDIAYIPHQDHYGNWTDQGCNGNSAWFGTTPPGTPPPTGVLLTQTQKFSNGYTRTDEEVNSVNAAAINAADCAAQTIRADTNINPVIYTIGLGGTTTEPIDDIFLERIANDTRSPIYNPNQKTGSYVKAANASQLSAAFAQVASQILRLSQ